MIIFLKNIAIVLVILGIINGVFSVITKGIVKKYGFTTFPLFSQISDIRNLKKLLEKDSSYKVLYYSYVISSILMGLDTILILITIIFISLL